MSATLRRQLSSIMIIVTLFVMMIGVARAAIAPVNIVSYQGRLLNSQGVPVSGSSAQIIFKLYDAANGGNCLWSNYSSTCAGASSAQIVSLSAGLFSENLGDASVGYATIPDSVFADYAEVYLGVTVGGDAEMTPRKRITAAPYALNAQSLDGLDSSAFVKTSGPFNGASQLVQLDGTGKLPAIDGSQLTGIGGGGTWGSISGTLSNQTDLQDALDAKLSLTGGSLTGLLRQFPSANQSVGINDFDFNHKYLPGGFFGSDSLMTISNYDHPADSSGGNSGYMLGQILDYHIANSNGIGSLIVPNFATNTNKDFSAIQISGLGGNIAPAIGGGVTKSDFRGINIDEITDNSAALSSAALYIGPGWDSSIQMSGSPSIDTANTFTWKSGGNSLFTLATGAGLTMQAPLKMSGFNSFTLSKDSGIEFETGNANRIQLKTDGGSPGMTQTYTLSSNSSGTLLTGGNAAANITGLTNTNIDNNAQIAYSKLSLSNSVKSSDIDTSNPLNFGQIAYGLTLQNGDGSITGDPGRKFTFNNTSTVAGQAPGVVFDYTAPQSLLNPKMFDAIQIVLNSGNSGASSTEETGIRFFTTATSSDQSGIHFGSGWDQAIDFSGNSAIRMAQGTNLTWKNNALIPDTIAQLSDSTSGITTAVGTLSLGKVQIEGGTLDFQGSSLNVNGGNYLNLLGSDTVNLATGANTLNVGTGAPVSGALNIGTGSAGLHTIAIGDANADVSITDNTWSIDASGNIVTTGTLQVASCTGCGGGGGSFADGTALAPSISFTSDTNTGIYRPANDQIGFAAGGSNVLSLSGNALTFLANNKFSVNSAGYITIGDGQGIDIPNAGTQGISFGYTNATLVNIGSMAATNINIGNTNIGVPPTLTRTVRMADAPGTNTIKVGGVGFDAADTVSIATDATSADTITIGNMNASTLSRMNGRYLYLDNATGIHNIEIGGTGGNDATDAINIATNGATADSISIGNSAAATYVSLDSGSSGIYINDHAGTSNVYIGGNAVDATNTIQIATNGTSADTLTIGNSNTGTTLALTGGDDWSITGAGLITTAGNFALNGGEITSTSGTFNILDQATAKTIDIGGVTNDGTDIINIATNGSANADEINIGNMNSSTLTRISSRYLLLNNTTGTHTIEIGGTGANDATDTINIATNGTTADSVVIGNSSFFTTVSLNGGANGGGLYLNDSGAATTVHTYIGGNALNQTDAIQIATNGTSADTISIGNTNTGTSVGISGSTTLTRAAAGTSTLTINGIASGTAPELSIWTKNVFGSLLNIGYSAASTLSNGLTGINLDLFGNVTNTTQSVTGLSIATPTTTGMTAGTKIAGITIENPGTVTSTSGTSSWAGMSVYSPSIIQTGGTLSATNYFARLNVANITTGGTLNGFNVFPFGTASGVGTVNGMNIGSITDGTATTTNGISIGSGWDTGISLASGVGIDTTASGTLNFGKTNASTVSIGNTSNTTTTSISSGVLNLASDSVGATNTAWKINIGNGSVASGGNQEINIASGNGSSLLGTHNINIGLYTSSAAITGSQTVSIGRGGGDVRIGGGWGTLGLTGGNGANGTNWSITTTGTITGSFATANSERLCWSGSGTSAITDCTGSPGDYAEQHGSSDATIVTGDIVVVDPSHSAEQIVDADGRKGSKSWILKSSQTYQSSTVGIVSTDPNEVIGQNFQPEEHPYPVALNGRVPVNVTNENGPIHVGDYITTSSTPGKGMKATAAGRVIGMALADFTDAQGQVMVQVNNSWYLGNLIGNDGTSSVMTDNVIVAPVQKATATNTSFDSYGLALRGSAWDGAQAQTVSMMFKNKVTDGTNYRLSVRNTADSEVAYITNNGTMQVAGDMVVGGKIYPSNMGSVQTDKYIYYDGSAGPGGDFMRTNASGWSTGSYDFAEMFPSEQKLLAGDVVVFTDKNESVARSSKTNEKAIAGIVSTRPGFLAGENKVGDYPIALAGRVPTNVNLEGGTIAVGDALTTSSTPGFAMKATKAGPIVGYALEPYTGSSVGQIKVFVEAGYWGGDATSSAPGTDNSASQFASGGTQTMIALSMNGDINMMGNTIANVGRMTGLAGAWSIESDGTVKTESLLKTVITGHNNQKVETVAVTSPEAVITFSGTTTLKNGEAEIRFVDVNKDYGNVISAIAPIRVVATPSGPVSLYVSEKDQNHFVVKSFGSSTSDVDFDWAVTAYRKGYEPKQYTDPVVEPVLSADAPTVSTDSTSTDSSASSTSSSTTTNDSTGTDVSADAPTSSP